MYYTKKSGQALDGALATVKVNGSEYQIGHDASSTEAGIVKMYDQIGENTDGTITQAAIKNAIDGASASSKTAVVDATSGQNFVNVTLKAKAEGETNDTYQVAVSDIQSASAFDSYKSDVIGTPTEGKTVVGMINDNANAISTLNAGSTTEGSVAYQIAQIVNENNNGDIDTLNEIAAWIVNDTTGAAKMSADISGLSQNKADKVSGATNGNFAGLDSNGNLTDSGKKASDFVSAADYVAYSQEEKTKLAGISENAQVNVLEGVTITGGITSTGEATITNKKASISIPTATSHLTNDSNFVSDANYNHTDNNYTNAEKNKLAAISMMVEGNTLVLVSSISV